MEVSQKDKFARKQKTGINAKLAPILRKYGLSGSPSRRADPRRFQRIAKLIDDNRIPGSEPYKQLLKQLSEMENMYEADPITHSEVDFGWFIHEFDKQLERDRIYSAADIIRTVEVIKKEEIQLVAYLVVN